MNYIIETADVVVLPFFLKIAVLFFIILSGAFMYLIIMNSVKISYFYYFISM